MPKSAALLPAVLAAAVSACPAKVQAAEFTVAVPEAAAVERRSVAYVCEDGGALTVDYINAADVSLAVFAWQDATVVAAVGPSGSGARYAGGRYVWWTKGAAATLHDALAGPDAAPLASCRATP